MNNSEIGAAFVAMVNNQREKKDIQGRNNLHIKQVGENLALYSYSTPIAVYNGQFVVLNDSFLSAATAKHQSHICRRDFDCPVSIVLHFEALCYTCSDLIKQAAPLYSYKKQVFTASNGRNYTRFVLSRENPYYCPTYGYYGKAYEIHRYTSEQAAKDETQRLNILACGQLTNL